MSSDNPSLPPQFPWNEAVLESGNSLNDGLVSIVAFDDKRCPVLIGTGFIVGTFEEQAICCTAAHNFSHVKQLQETLPRHHRTALAEFLPRSKPLNIDRKILRAFWQV